MKYLFIGFLLFTQMAFSQEAPAKYWNNLCDFKTDGTGKSLGLKIKLSFPCRWKQADGDRPHVVQKFSDRFKGGGSIIEVMTITKLPGEPSKREISGMFTQNGLKEFAKEIGTFISGRKLQIDGIDCGEVIIKTKRESPIATIYIYFIQYYIIFKDKLISLSFGAGDKSESETKKLFDIYKVLFRGLAGNTVILSQWE